MIWGDWETGRWGEKTNEKSIPKVINIRTARLQDCRTAGPQDIKTI